MDVVVVFGVQLPVSRTQPLVGLGLFARVSHVVVVVAAVEVGAGAVLGFGWHLPFSFLAFRLCTLLCLPNGSGGPSLFL